MPVVAGIDAFRDAMAGFEGSYVLIGGAACSVLFVEAGLSFRATHDLDVVMVADTSNGGFGKALWSFVREGGYRCGRRADGRATYYRFELPKGSPNTGRLPSMIELFSRRPDFRLSTEGSAVAPLPLDEAASSLSAIVLDDDYYAFIRDNATLVDGVSLLSAVHIVPLKMRAHIDLNARRSAGEAVDSKKLRKHRSDVVALVGLLPANARLELSGSLKSDAGAFIDDLASYAERETNRKRRGLSDAARLRLEEVYL